MGLCLDAPALALTCLHPPVSLGLCRVAAGGPALPGPPATPPDCPSAPGRPCLAPCPAADFPFPLLGAPPWPCSNGLPWQLIWGFPDVVACSGLTPHLPAGERDPCREAGPGPEPLRAQNRRTPALPSGLSPLAGWGSGARARGVWPLPPVHVAAGLGPRPTSSWGRPARPGAPVPPAAGARSTGTPESAHAVLCLRTTRKAATCVLFKAPD